MKPSEQEWRSGCRIVNPPLANEVEQIQAYFEGMEAGTFQPVEPRKAATVMLVRQEDPAHLSPYRSAKPAEQRLSAPNGIEIFLLRRQRSMKFAPDAVTFPGGRVDSKDAAADLPWAGPSPAQWAQILGCDETTARMILSAAIREVFEESSVLLAGPDENSLVTDTSSEEWTAERVKLVEHEQCLSELLIRRNLVIRTDLLNFISNWCTPEYCPRRYDTYFFTALCPQGQSPDDRSRESYIADWAEPQWAFDLADEGTINLLPPTVYNLGVVARAKDLDDLMGTAHPAQRVMKYPVKDEHGTVTVQGMLP